MAGPFYLHLRISGEFRSLVQKSSFSPVNGLRFARQLHLTGKLAPLTHPKFFAVWLRPLFRKDWMVYSTPPFGRTRVRPEYLDRYTIASKPPTTAWSHWQTARLPFAGETPPTTIGRKRPSRATSFTVASHYTCSRRASNVDAGTEKRLPALYKMFPACEK